MNMDKAASPTPPPADRSAPPPGSVWRRRLKWAGIIGGTLLLVMVALVAGGEYYTSRPQFCGTCHIMDPYYKTWKKDVHSTKAQAWCVDCHYAPGEQHTIKAKFKGLSQLASYFSGRAGAGRPKAHVRDESCLTSQCHGDLKFMTAELKMGTARFVHANHLRADSPVFAQKRTQLATLHQQLAQQLRPDDLAALEQVARSVQPAAQRGKQLADWLDKHRLSSLAEEISNLVDLLRCELQIDQSSQLRCSACHEFDSSLGSHMAVQRGTCYTCHFANQPFNTGTGRCLMCHEPPTKRVLVHPGEGQPSAQGAPAAEAVTMDHTTMVANKVDCFGCHGDLIHGTGQVTRRDCQNCHDRDDYLKNFGQLTADLVRDYHRAHSATQRARCGDCHQAIEHKLKPLADPGDAVALLAPVRDGCQHCHPDHHRQQMELLLGRGGFAGGAKGLPNPMTGSRINCQACHLETDVDPIGDPVMAGTSASCRTCHSEDYEKLFHRWQTSLQTRLTESQQLLAAVEQRLQAASQPAGRDVSEPASLHDRAKQSIRLVEIADGLHNKNYAMMLLDQAVADLSEALKLLGG